MEIYWNSHKAMNALKYVTAHYSIFDFLLGLGTYFGTQKEYHKYSSTDVFDIMTQYAEINHPTDLVLKELIAVDYYLHFKVKPKTLFLNEVAQTEKTEIINTLKLNHHKYRFIALPLHFNYKTFSSHNKIEKGAHHLIIQYNGTTKAVVVED